MSDTTTPALAQTIRGIFSAALAGATAASVVLLASMVFLAFAQSQWSLEFFARALCALQAAGGAWALVVHTPIWLLVERRGWNRYLCLVLEALALVPIVALVQLVFGILDLETFLLALLVLLIPALVLAGASGLAAKRARLRRRGWLIWLIVTGAGLVVWFFAGILPGMLR